MNFPTKSAVKIIPGPVYYHILHIAAGIELELNQIATKNPTAPTPFCLGEEKGLQEDF